MIPVSVIPRNFGKVLIPKKNWGSKNNSNTWKKKSHKNSESGCSVPIIPWMQGNALTLAFCSKKCKKKVWRMCEVLPFLQALFDFDEKRFQLWKIPHSGLEFHPSSARGSFHGKFMCRCSFLSAKFHLDGPGATPCGWRRPHGKCRGGFQNPAGSACRRRAPAQPRSGKPSGRPRRTPRTAGSAPWIRVVPPIHPNPPATLEAPSPGVLNEWGG